MRQFVKNKSEKMKKLPQILVMASILIVAVACNQEKTTMRKAIDTNNLDLTANPGEDFNQYANGGWMQKNPIPDDKSRFGSFDQLADENEKQVRGLVEELAEKPQEEGSVADKIAVFYNTGMDTTKIEAQGISVLKEEFDRINQLTTVADVQQLLAYNHSHGVSSLYGIYGGADAKNSGMVITHLYQSGLGMPDRDYYLSENERFIKIREKYFEHLIKNFELLGNDGPKAETKAGNVLAIETRLAKASMDRLTLRDPHKRYNKYTVEELAEFAPAINWNSYFEQIGLGNPETLIVSQPDFIAEVNAMMTDVSMDEWKDYFTWKLVKSSAPYLNHAFVDANFDFYGKTMQGTPEQKPRWKRVLNTTNAVLSEAVGQMYVKKYFPPEAKQRMLDLVGNLKLALGERIEQVKWMGDDTKTNALDKLEAMNVKIGYPDTWQDYSALQVKDDAYVLNIMRARQFGFNDMIQKINKPVDESEWHMPPQMVNAYYNPLQNEIVFPAGILQPPFFYMHEDDAVNYGAIGVVIGHEMTHGFDDKGRLFDKEGNLNTWWSKEDEERFNKRSEVLVEQYDNFIVLDTVHANGKYSLGENIADLGGINIAYTAFKKTEQWKNQQDKLDGYSPDQRFFLAYAHVWAQNIRDEEILRRTQEDVHSLGKYRVIGPLRNVPEFHKAFDVKEGDYMFLAKKDRADIW